MTVRQVVSMEVTALPEHERDAVWLQTPEGEQWDAEEEDDREKVLLWIEDSIIDYLTNDYVYSVGCQLEQTYAFGKYLEQSSRTD